MPRYGNREEALDAALVAAVKKRRGQVLTRLVVAGSVPARGPGDLSVQAHFELALPSDIKAWDKPLTVTTGKVWPPDGVIVEPLLRSERHEQDLFDIATAWVVKVSREHALPAPYVLMAADA